MAKLKKTRIQLLNEDSGQVLEDVDVLTSAECVSFADTQNLEVKNKAVQSTLSTHTNDISGLKSRVGNAESTISNHGSRLGKAEGKIAENEKAIATKSPIGHDHNSVYVAKSGGTMTGELICNNYLKVNAWPGYGTGSSRFWYDANTTTLYVDGGPTNLKIGSNTVYHTGKKPTPEEIQASRNNHNHDGRYANASHGNHVPSTQPANNATFLRNDNSWQKVTAANIGAADRSHNHNYLPGNYVGGGKELPNYFGKNLLKLQMLNTDWGWSDTLWMSSYGGGDVKGSNQLVMSKSGNRIGFRTQNYDSSSWGTLNEIYHTGKKPTASEIGAAEKGHSHNYLPLTGGKLTGSLYVNQYLVAHQGNSFLNFELNRADGELGQNGLCEGIYRIGGHLALVYTYCYVGSDSNGLIGREFPLHRTIADGITKVYGGMQATCYRSDTWGYAVAMYNKKTKNIRVDGADYSKAQKGSFVQLLMLVEFHE